MTGIDELLRSNVWLAPMAGINDPVFRGMCAQEGAGLTFTEMISACGLAYGNEKTWGLVDLDPHERRLAVQLFGREPQNISEQAARVEEHMGAQLALIDINMGCPVRKVVRKGEGCALMRTPQLAADIVRATAAAVQVPVTVKFRSGWAAGENSAPEFARRMEDAGAAAVCVHGRSATQMYTGTSDRRVIAESKQAVSIPVLASGDIFSHEDIADVLSETGADGVMVARGARGNPWIFSGAKPGYPERIDAALVHARGLVRLDPQSGVVRMRTHLMFYLSGMPHAARVRQAIMCCETLPELEQLLAGVKAALQTSCEQNR